MSFEIPHKKDLSTNSKLPGMLTENAEAVEKVINTLLARIEKLEAKYKDLESSKQQENNDELIVDENVLDDSNDGQTTAYDINQTENITLN